MLQYHDATMTATVFPTTAETLATAPARSWTRKEHGRHATEGPATEGTPATKETLATA